MAAKKKTPAKKKPALKKKPFTKSGAKAAAKSAAKSGKKAGGKPAAKSKTGGKAGGKTAGKTGGKTTGAKRPGRTSKRPSASRKVAAKKVAAKAPKSKAKVAEAPEALALARSIAKVAAEKKAENILILDVRSRSAAVGYDYVVLASGESDRQLSAIHEGVDELLKPQGRKPAAVEASADWVCVTYDEGVVAHFFTPDRRELMDLEDMWSDAPRVSA
jgi:ribosome-associated protein